MSHQRPRGLLALLTAALVVGIVALVLSFQNAVDLNRQADQRNADRIASDLAACRRGNTFRQQVIDVGDASDAAIRQILDRIFATTTSPEAAALRRQLDVPLAQLRTTIASIHLTDCRAAVPGARSTP
jgi:hypothetical protein